MREELRIEIKKELKKEISQAQASCVISIIGLVVAIICAAIDVITLPGIIIVVCMACVVWCTVLMYNGLKKKTE